MTFYTLFSRPEAGPEAVAAVKQRFFWTAFLFTPFWAMLHRAWGFLLLWVLIFAVALASALWMDGVASAAVYLVFVLWSGFAAPQIAERSLVRRGWMAHGTLVAPDRETAESLWLKRLYGARR